MASLVLTSAVAALLLAGSPQTTGDIAAQDRAAQASSEAQYRQEQLLACSRMRATNPASTGFLLELNLASEEKVRLLEKVKREGRSLTEAEQRTMARLDRDIRRYFYPNDAYRSPFFRSCY